MQFDELREIEDAARDVTSDGAVMVLADPDLVLRRAAQYRQAAIDATRNGVGWSEAADLRDKLAHRFAELRRALRAILEIAPEASQAEARAQTLAKEALASDDEKEQLLISEFGIGVDDLIQGRTEPILFHDVQTENSPAN